MLKATLAAEDVNLLPAHRVRRPGGVVRALVNNVHAGPSRGLRGAGSTITQQPVKAPSSRTSRATSASCGRSSWRCRWSALPQGADPGAVPQPGLLREPGLRGGGGRPLLLRQARQGAQPGGSLAAGRPGAALSRYDPVQNPKAALRQSDVLDVMVRYELVTKEADAARGRPPVHLRMSETQIRLPHFAFSRQGRCSSGSTRVLRTACR